MTAPNLALRLEFELRPELRISPSLITDVNCLELSFFEFQKKLDEFIAQNPLIDNCEPRLKSDLEEARIIKKAIKAKTHSHFGTQEKRHRQINSNRDFDPLAFIEARKPTLTEHLSDQLKTIELREIRKFAASYQKGSLEKLIRYSPSLSLLMKTVAAEEHRKEITPEDFHSLLDAMNNIISSLSEHGHLESRIELMRIRGHFCSNLNNSNTTASRQEYLFAIAFAFIQTLEPAGICSLDTPECMLIQLALDRQEYHLERILLQNHWQDLVKENFDTITRNLMISRSDIQDSFDILSWLDPRPGRRFRRETESHLRPDATIYLEGTELVVKLAKAEQQWIALNPHYRQMLREAKKDPEKLRKLKADLLEARSLIHLIEYRESMFMSLLKEVIKKQKGYLLNIEPLQALQMTELANTLGVTHSTISRLCKNRYIETPIGTIPLRKLFEVGTIKGKNTTHTKSYALAVLEEIIKTEDILHPFSDKKIQHELELRGIFISIRTVGKFRDVLQIPSAKFRKDSPGFIKSHERSAEILGKILNKPWSAKKSTKNIQDILKRLGLFSTLRQISRARMALSK